MASIEVTSIKPVSDNRLGWDITVFMISDDNRTGYKTFYFGQVDPPQEYDYQYKLDKFIAEFNLPPEDTTIFTRKEINAILVHKKYFTNGMKFPDDLPEKPK